VPEANLTGGNDGKSARGDEFFFVIFRQFFPSIIRKLAEKLKNIPTG
jgi:hypothetical protein